MLPYIEIRRFGIQMHQMRDTDCDTVYHGRNQPFVRQSHFYTDVISQEQHNAWYRRISNSRDYYLVATKDGVSMGLLYMKDISPGMLSGQIGVFFWKDNILRTRMPILAIISFVDFFLAEAGLQNMEAMVRMDNKSMVNIVRFFKFNLHYDKDKNSVTGNLTRKRYLTRRPALIKFAQRLSQARASWQLQVFGEKDPRHHAKILRIIP